MLSLKTQRGLIWILIPFIYGWLANRTGVIIPPVIAQVVFGIFWLWTGAYFAQIKGSRLKHFLLGNSVWALSFGLFLWQFIYTSADDRLLFLAGWSQHYMLAFLWSGVRLYRLIDSTLHGTHITLTAYIVMFVLFTLGFAWRILRGRSQNRPS